MVCVICSNGYPGCRENWKSAQSLTEARRLQFEFRQRPFKEQTMSIKVSLVEDNTTIRESLAEILDASTGFRLGDACCTGEEALRMLPKNPPDVVLMDINLPRLDGIRCVNELKRALPATQFVMLTIEDDSQRVFDSLKA